MNATDISLLIVIFISILLLSCIWLVYVKYKIYIKHPNKMIFVVITFQIMNITTIALTIIITGHIPTFKEFSGPDSIIALRYLMRFFGFFPFLYIMLINIEVLIKLRKNIGSKHRSRLIIYNVLCFILSVFYTIFGRLRGDRFLESYNFGKVFFYYSIITIIASTILIIIYIFFKYYSKIKSNDMIFILWLAIDDILISLLVLLISEFSNEAIYFLISAEGIIEFFIFYTYPNTRKYILNLFLPIKRQKTNYLRSSQEILLAKKIENHKQMQTRTGLIFEVFENITKNVTSSQTLVVIFTAISLRFMKNEGIETTENSTFFFNKNDINNLKQVVNLDLLSSRNSYLVSLKELSLVDYYFQKFNNIREKYLEEDILSSFLQVSNYFKLISLKSESGGRSDSFIFVTSDKRFRIKTISKHDYKAFSKRLFSRYYDRIIDNSGSKIVRIFALFKMKYFRQFVIIMENIVEKKEESIIFDLKGSKVGRNVKDIRDCLNPPKGVVLKDVNFENFGYKIVLPASERETITGILKEDFLLLKECGIMDYSILLSIRENDSDIKTRLSFVDLRGKIITIGIIDFFQEYNLSKFSETAMKSILNKAMEVSSINPEQYYYRITEYLAEILL